MASEDLDSLIIRNIADLDDATRRLYVLNEKIAGEIDNIIKILSTEWGWRGQFEWTWKGELWTAPSEWAADAEAEDFDAWFSWDNRHGATGPNGEEDTNWVTSLCNAGYGELGFRFDQDVLAGKKALKDFWRKHVDEVKKFGFILDDKPSLFLPVHIDREALAAAVADGNIKAGLEPLRTAFETLVRARPAFEKIIVALKEAAAK